MEHNQPEIGLAAVKVLRKLGYEIIIPARCCCGRPQISKGLLQQARQKAVLVIKTLLPYASEKIPIIGLEPSCILTIKDDYPDLIPGTDSETVAAMCMTIDEFLNSLVNKGEFNLNFKEGERKILFHGHCFQKALTGTQATMNVLKSLPSAEVEEIDSGCCGMAGSFGYEKEHYKFSMKVGEARLFPKVRKAHWKWRGSRHLANLAAGTSVLRFIAR